MSDRSDHAVIEGAGGIVERHTPDGIRIAVVSRKRYGDEWSLPKGKRKPNESLQETALREIEEEIGLRAVIIGIAGSNFYLAQGVPKLVAYWRMRIEGDVPPFTPSEEVTALDWLLPEAAIERLTHADQKEVVRKAFPQSSLRRPNIADWFDRQIGPIFLHRRLKRLATEIRSYKEELQGRAPNCNRSIETVEAAERAVAEGDIELGWKRLQTARRLELAASKDPDEIKAAAIAIRREADRKLDGWRKTAVNELLPVTNGKTLSGKQVCDAAWIRDEHYNNEAYKDGLRRSNALFLALSLFAALFVLLCIARNGYLEQAIALTEEAKGPTEKAVAPTEKAEAPMEKAESGKLLNVLISLAVVGWLGATISAITKLPKQDVPSRIPELVSSFRITMLRLLMGPALAIIAYFVTKTDLSKSIFLVKAEEGPIILIIAFAAGFSERLVVRVVEAIERKSTT